MTILTKEEQDFLSVLRERNAYRDALTEVAEVLPNLKQIFTRLHAGSDAMRDEGCKLWLVCGHLDYVLSAFQYEEVLVNSDGEEIGGTK